MIYEISYEILIGAKPLRVMFDKVDGFIRVYDGTRYLVLFGPEKYDAIYNSVRYLITQKSDITYVLSHNYARIKIDSSDSLPLEKHWLCIMLSDILSQFWIMIKIPTTLIYS